MAILGDVYAPHEFRLAIKNETTVGTANTTQMQLVNIDPGSVKVSENVFIANTPRTGVYRVMRKSDYFSSEKGSIKSISFSGIGNLIIIEYFLTNIIGSTNYVVPYNYLPAEMKIGDYKTDYDGTMTIALISPISGNTRLFTGCVIDELTITADPTVDGGRWHFSAVALSPCISTDEQATPSQMTDFSTMAYSFYNTTANQINDSDVVLSKYSISLKSNVKFYGFDSNGQAQIIARAIPTFDAKIELSAKFDSNTKSLFQELADGDDNKIEIYDQVTPTFGIAASYCKLISEANLSVVNDGTFVDLVFQPMASTSGNLIEFISA